MSVAPKEELEVGLFFYVNGNFAFSGCKLPEAETYGDFLIFLESHIDVWNNYHHLRFKNLKQKVDYDYYPRGRVVYRKSDDTFIIYHDRCIEQEIHYLAKNYSGCKIILESDEHYCCHRCNPNYVI